MEKKKKNSIKPKMHLCHVQVSWVWVWQLLCAVCGAWEKVGNNNVKLGC